ncbi:MAG: ribonuclease P protein component [Bacteroidales bacterium]|nr:ribonuclease P protein component [Bacteroidales bacterium]
MRATFPKSEHLCRLGEIEKLFSAGSRSATVYPLRLVYRKVKAQPDTPRVKVLLSVAKRRLRHAVDRNRAKRQLRESYRHEKECLLRALAGDEALHLGLIWLAEAPQPSDLLRATVHTLLERVAENLDREHLRRSESTQPVPTQD